MSKGFNYNGKVVKQGNSLCVRIPNMIKKKAGIKEGIEVNITIEKVKMKYCQEDIEEILRLANKVAELNRYSEEKKRFFIILNLKFVEEVIGESEEEQLRFIEKMKDEFGHKLVGEWLLFERIFNEVAFHTDKEFTILKEKYGD